MEEKIIDCARIHNREDLHAVFREALTFPECSGKVRLLDWEIAEARLGDYGKKAKKVIAAAALRNTDLDLYI